MERGAGIKDTGIELRIPIGARTMEARVLASQLPRSGVTVYLIDQPRYFDRDGLYGSVGGDYDDNCERFVFFNRAVLETLRVLGRRVRHRSLQRLADRVNPCLP